MTSTGIRLWALGSRPGGHHLIPGCWLEAGSPEPGVIPYVEAAIKAKELGLGLNAGHDLDLNNLKFLKQHIPWLDEVSIGHALICDALYLGFENAIQLYKRALK